MCRVVKPVLITPSKRASAANQLTDRKTDYLHGLKQNNQMNLKNQALSCYFTVGYSHICTGCGYKNMPENGYFSEACGYFCANFFSIL